MTFELTKAFLFKEEKLCGFISNFFPFQKRPVLCYLLYSTCNKVVVIKTLIIRKA